MRTIKFRGQTVDTKELIYGDLIQTEKDFKNVVEILDWSKVGCKPEKSLVVNPETVGQFTGLVDKNGIEIYEGDILSDWNEVDGNQVQSHLQVFWCNDTGAYKLDNSFNQDKSSGDLLSEELLGFSYEITGNIYENPELK